MLPLALAVLLLAIVSAACGASQTGPQNRPIGGIFGPVWSPDGTRIAFALDNARTLEIYVYELRNHRITGLTHGVDRSSEPAWSPDSMRIAYNTPHRPSDGTSDLYVMHADGTGKQRLATRAREPACSPDGRRIVYWVEDYSGPDQLAVVTPTGRLLKTIALPRRFYLRFSFWSPDNREIAFTADGGIGPAYAIGRDGKHLHRLTPLVDGLATRSRDWKHIVYISANGDLYKTDSPFTHSVRLTRTPDIETDATWSPDNKQIAFTRNAPDGTHRALYVIESDGTKERRLVSR